MIEIGISIADLLVRSGLCKSKGEARRSIAQGGVRLGGEQITNPTASLVMSEGKLYLLTKYLK